MVPIIAHIDMNSYFASCEQQDDISLRGKPVGVCEHLGGIIISPSIEAKQWGIKGIMPVWEAKKLYPKIYLTRTHPERYRYYSRKIVALFQEYTAQVDRYSIDEAFLDLTEVCNVQKSNQSGILVRVDPYIEAENIAREIKKRIQNEVGDWLKCSVGIGSSKLQAKLGSDMQKPDGLVVLRPEMIPFLYEKLKLIDIPGIGRRQERRLNRLGIYTLAQLRDYPESKLVTHFGIAGAHLASMGRLEGSFGERFGSDASIKSMGHMYTLPKSSRMPGSASGVLFKLCEMVAKRMRAQGMVGFSINAFVELEDKEWVSGGKRLHYAVGDGKDIFFESRALLLKELYGVRYSVKNVEKFNTLAAKFIGITVAELKPASRQLSLWPIWYRQSSIGKVLDKIDKKYGDFTIARTPAFFARKHIRDSVGFGRIKEW